MSSNFQINQSNIVHQTIEGEVVIINLNTGDYYSLVNVGVRIWNLLEKTTTIEYIVNTLNIEYISDGVNIEEIVTQFINELKKESLVVSLEIDSDEQSSPVKNVSTDDNSDKLPFEIPSLQKFSDMQELLLIDPIHEVDEMGWPRTKPKEIK